jgi:hypothetical protein
MKRSVQGLVLFAAVSGAALLLGVTQGVASPRAPAVQSDEKADELVDQWIQALGGMEAYGQLKTARFTVTTEIYDADSGRLRRTRPRYVTIARTDLGEISRIERWEGDDFIQHGWDGVSQWAQMNGEPLAPGDKDFDQARYVSGDVQYWISLPFKLRDPGVNLHYRELGDAGRHVVGVTFGEGVGLHDGDTWRYWFEDGKIWPVQIAYMEEGSDRWNRLRFEDIRSVDGYIFAGRRVHHDESGRLTKVLYTHDFEFNPELDFALFSGPG